jgi:hypothetical protein
MFFSSDNILSIGFHRINNIHGILNIPKYKYPNT